MMRVLHVISDTNVGGAGRYLMNLIKYTDPEEVQIDVACPFHGKLQEALEQFENVTLLELPDGDKSFTMNQYKTLKEYMSQKYYHVVHTHGNLAGRIAGTNRNVKVRVYTKHGFSGSNIGTKLMNQGLFWVTDGIIAVSKAVKIAMIKDSIPGERIRIILNGIDMEEVDEAPKGNLREMLSVPEGVPLIGVVARLTPVKGHKDFLRAVKLLREEGLSFRVALIGDGDMKEELEQEIMALGLEDIVKMTGYVGQVMEAIKCLDIAVLPSEEEGLGLSILESMAAGVPTAASNTGGIPEVITHMETGLLFEPKNPTDMADKIKMLLTDEALKKELAERGKAFVRENYNAEKMAKDTEKFYVDIYKTKWN